MPAIDTDVLLRLIIQDDARQASAAEGFIEKGAWVSVLALAEAAWVLTTVYHVTPAALADAIEMLLDHQHLVMQDSDVVAAALELFRAKPKVGFSDCLMLHLARKAGHQSLGTFDRSLARIDGAQLL